MVERHPHSQDIYTDETRFAPLGSDATIVYGYKDFRFEQTLAMPICLRFELRDREICAMLCAPQPIPEYTIDFQREQIEGSIKVNTVRLINNSKQPEVLHSTIYKTRQAIGL